MKVMKFGGSSLATAERIRTVAQIVASQSEEPVVVLSAMKGVTDLLTEAADKAEAGDRSYREDVTSLLELHRQVVLELMPGNRVGESIEAQVAELVGILHGIELIRECSDRSRDLIMSFGELLSCTLFAAYMEHIRKPAWMLDARTVIVTDQSHGRANVLPDSYRRIREAVEAEKRIPVVTGFIAATESGVTTTLGRNGSDYTASVVGAAVGASVVEIWTDVDGVMSADPRAVESAFVVPRVSFQEAMELAYFGARVLHPFTMLPVLEAGIPLRIKNTLNPQAPGTLISAETVEHETAITGIASIEGMALINVEGGGMMGIPGFAARVFGAIGHAGVNVIMISQASSEHSICLVMREHECGRAESALKAELAAEIAAGRLQRPEVVRSLAVIAVIGENMRGRPGISARMFGALGKESINILAIAQGSSERNISIVVSERQKTSAVKAIHHAFMEESGGDTV